MAKTVTTMVRLLALKMAAARSNLEKQVTAEMGVGFRKQTITNKLETILIILTNQCLLPH